MHVLQALLQDLHFRLEAFLYRVTSLIVASDHFFRHLCAIIGEDTSFVAQCVHTVATGDRLR